MKLSIIHLERYALYPLMIKLRDYNILPNLVTYSLTYGEKPDELTHPMLLNLFMGKKVSANRSFFYETSTFSKVCDATSVIRKRSGIFSLVLHLNNFKTMGQLIRG